MLSLHTVLGYNITDPDTARLKAMLFEAVRRKGRLPPSDPDARQDPRWYQTTTWPFWAQDFLDLYQPAALG